jgi:hypothetical protein
MPLSVWLFSNNVATIRGNANALPFKVCASCVLPSALRKRSLSGYFGRSRSLIRMKLPASVVVPRSRFPYHKLRRCQNPYRRRKGAIHGKANLIFATGPAHGRSYLPVHRMIYPGVLPVLSLPYQTGAGGSNRVRAHRMNLPRGGNKVYVRNF